MIPYSLDNSSYDNLIVGIWNRQLSVFRTGDEYPYKGIGCRYYIPTIAGTKHRRRQMLNTNDDRCWTSAMADTEYT